MVRDIVPWNGEVVVKPPDQVRATQSLGGRGGVLATPSPPSGCVARTWSGGETCFLAMSAGQYLLDWNEAFRPSYIQLEQLARPQAEAIVRSTTP